MIKRALPYQFNEIKLLQIIVLTLTPIKQLGFYQQTLNPFTFFIYTFCASSDKLMTVNTLALGVIFPQVMCI